MHIIGDTSKYVGCIPHILQQAAANANYIGKTIVSDESCSILVAVSSYEF